MIIFATGLVMLLIACFVVGVVRKLGSVDHPPNRCRIIRLVSFVVFPPGFSDGNLVARGPRVRAPASAGHAPRSAFTVDTGIASCTSGVRYTHESREIRVRFANSACPFAPDN